MILYIKSDVAYLVLPKPRSHTSGVFFLSDRCAPSKRPTTNSLIGILCKTIKNFVASADESETGAIFINTQHDI